MRFKSATDKAEGALSQKQKGHQACQQAFDEVYATLSTYYTDFPKAYTEALDFKELHSDDFFLLKNWMYIRAKQILVNQFNSKFQDIWNAEHPYTRTDKRLEMGKLILKTSHRFPFELMKGQVKV